MTSDSTHFYTTLLSLYHLPSSSASSTYTFFLLSLLNLHNHVPTISCLSSWTHAGTAATPFKSASTPFK